MCFYGGNDPLAGDGGWPRAGEDSPRSSPGLPFRWITGRCAQRGRLCVDGQRFKPCCLVEVKRFVRCPTLLRFPSSGRLSSHTSRNSLLSVCRVHRWQLPLLAATQHFIPGEQQQQPKLLALTFRTWMQISFLPVTDTSETSVQSCLLLASNGKTGAIYTDTLLTSITTA